MPSRFSSVAMARGDFPAANSLKDAADDHRLGFIDPAFTRTARLAIDALHHVVAVAEPAVALPFSTRPRKPR